jgi:transketolase
VHVPGHHEEARRLLLESLPGDGKVYVRLSEDANAESHLGVGFQVMRQGSRGVVLAIGPTLDRVLAATISIDVTVLYASTIRPFDAVGLRAAVRSAVADVVVVEPYLAGTSALFVAEALADIPHRLRSLGVRRDTEVRMYGEMADHDLAHGLDETSIAVAVKEFVR